jgi:hypothetical protein
LLHESFSSALACKNSFENVDMSGNSASNLTIKDNDDNELLESQEPYLSLNIEDFKLESAGVMPNTSNVLDLKIVAKGRDGTFFNPHDFKVTATLDGAGKINNCKLGNSPGSDAFDPSGNFRDGWVCSCNGDNTGSHEGIATMCILSIGGSIVDAWVAPDPYTKASSGNASCDRVAPDPPGVLPVLKWNMGKMSTRPTGTSLCDMDDGQGLINCL